MRDTSLTAYVQIQPKLGKLQKKCLTYIQQFPDHTYNELGKISGMGEGFRKRGSELEDKGAIYSNGTKIDKDSGKECHIWRAKE